MMIIIMNYHDYITNMSHNYHDYITNMNYFYEFGSSLNSTERIKCE
ncbi:hypothetical protein LTSEHVI_2941 [Salmonella enterica subsp. enterica serovar Hvittingfoss str. A4-620]|nr:hypothetical protein LTSEHVI_2941 [Salmonella enterica subsp. enterica serovar Hvittingfoss str. A4-620]